MHRLFQFMHIYAFLDGLKIVRLRHDFGHLMFQKAMLTVQEADQTKSRPFELIGEA